MEKGKAYLAIDPGSKGCIAIQSDKGREYYFICELDYYQLSEVFAKIREEYDDITCVMEQIHAIYGSSAKATFSFGEINGVLLGLLCANKIPYTLIPPKEWQTCMWTNTDKEYDYKLVKDKNGVYVNKKTVNTKKTSINAAKRLFPTEDFRRNPKCKNIDDNKVDALLMPEYARRKNL